MITAFHYHSSQKNEQIAYYFYKKNNNTTGNIDDIPLVLLHGFCEDSSLWQSLLERLSPLTNRTILAIDLGSFGESKLGETSMATMAGQVHSVLTHLNISKAVVLGHSMGGYVAMEMAALYSDRLAGLVLLHSHVFADSPEKKENRDKAIDFIERNGTAPFVKQLFYQLFEPDFARANTVLVENLIANARNIAPQTIIAASAAMRDRHDRSETLTNAKFPVLLISGQHDNTISEAQSLAQAALADSTCFVWLKNAGHMAMFEQPDHVVDALLGFLNS